MDYLHSTRGRLLASIKRRGAAPIEPLASDLAIAPSSVRQHLSALLGDGLVSVDQQRDRTGRPRQVYVVTPKGDALFPKRYAALAAALLEASEDSRPGPSLAAFVESEIAARKSRVNGLDTRTRMEEVAAIMRDDGGLTTVLPGPPLAISETNCVFAAVAALNPAICEAHVATVQRLLGVPTTFTRAADPFVGGCTWTAATETEARSA